MRRIFVFGCPRSGTTIVQAMLARHPDVFTLPETAFFEHLFSNLRWRWGDRNVRARARRLRHRLGFARSSGRRALRQIQRSLLGPSARDRSVPWRTRACTERFVALLDDMAERAGRSAWVEKTPNHLLYIPEIEAALPDARFVHVIRRGIDVVASVFDANLRFGEFDGGPALWAGRWNRAAQIHRRQMGRPRHHFVFLEDLIADSEGEWLRLCRFLDIPPDSGLTDTCSQTIADLEKEPWKHAAVAGVPTRSEHKADELFGPRMQRWLHGQLSSYDELRHAHAAARAGAPASRDGATGRTARDASPRSGRQAR